MGVTHYGEGAYPLKNIHFHHKNHTNLLTSILNGCYVSQEIKQTNKKTEQTNLDRRQHSNPVQRKKKKMPHSEPF